MTLSSTITLSADVIDAVSEAVAAPPYPAARASVIADLVTEMYATVQWRLGDVNADAELASLQRVVAEVQAHRDRMSAYR